MKNKDQKLQTGWGELECNLDKGRTRKRQTGTRKFPTILIKALSHIRSCIRELRVGFFFFKDIRRTKSSWTRSVLKSEEFKENIEEIPQEVEGKRKTRQKIGGRLGESQNREDQLMLHYLNDRSPRRREMTSGVLSSNLGGTREMPSKY